MKRTEIKMPTWIEAEMEQWREGMIPLPQSYIEAQKELALAAKPEIEAEYTIDKIEMVNDGWGDGMKFIQVTGVQKETMKPAIFKWSDSQAWFKKGDGWSLWEGNFADLLDQDEQSEAAWPPGYAGPAPEGVNYSDWLAMNNID